MAAQTVTFRGKALYCQPWPNQVDREYEDPDSVRGGNWSTKLIIDDDNLKLFNALGAKAKTKRIDELKKTEGLEDYLDRKYLTFRRYEYVDYGKGKEPLGAPEVSGVEEGSAIGNLSDVEVVVEVYPYTFKGKAGVAMRWLSLHVNDLVEYKKADPLVNTAPPVN